MIKLLTKNKENISVVAVPHLRIYIPEDYFDPVSPLARVINDSVETMGLFYLSQSSKEEISDKEIKYLAKIPTSFIIKTNKIESIVADIKGIKTPCKVLYLKKGDVFMNNMIQEDIKFVVNFIQKMLHAGKVPSVIGYTNILDYYLELLRFHKLDLKVPNFILEVIISELCRIKGQKVKRFRNEYGKATSKLTDRDFEMCNIKDLPHLSSNFSSLTFENMNKGLQMSIERTNTGKKESNSPIEKIIKY